MPTVSTPLAWDEVAACADGENPRRLVHGIQSIAARVERVGDLLAPVLTVRQVRPEG